LVAVALVLVVAVMTRPAPGLVVVAAGLLVVTLVLGEAVESERWRAGWRELVHAHGAAACFGFAGCAAALLAGATRLVSEPVAVTATVGALVLFGAVMAMVAIRLRR
jgi:hypothetical protein